MGFTLAAALRRLGPEARLIMVEMVPAVVRWNRETLGHLAEHPLRDSRVELRVEDVAETIRNHRRAFDAVLLDVDNSPQGFTSKSNDWLYSDRGLEAAGQALRDRGILAQWSYQADRSYVARLCKAGYSVEEARVRGRKGKGSHNVIWLSTRP
jgi:spermidine synthase